MMITKRRLFLGGLLLFTTAYTTAGIITSIIYDVKFKKQIKRANELWDKGNRQYFVKGENPWM